MKPLAVYVHIPFCFLKCHYCDFNAYGGRMRMEPLYFDALLADIDSWRDVLATRTVVSVAFGGGTPGDVPPASLAAVVDAIRDMAGHWDAEAEISLEANPGTMNDAPLPVLVRAGFNRISFGVQSFDPHELQFLDRVHSPEAAVAAVIAARCAGFEHLNVDLIYGLPGQTINTWLRSLEQAARLPVDHLSCYALTVEPGTRLARWVASGRVRMPDADDVADMYELAADILPSFGFEQYELSNWARSGGRSRHNLCYWTDVEYLGIGAGAHGYVDGVRYENVAHPKAYTAALLSHRSERAPGFRPAVATTEVPDRKTSLLDWIALRLRLVQGFHVGEFAAKFGRSFAEVFGVAACELQEVGLLEFRPDGVVRLTPRGRLLHTEVVGRLIANYAEPPADAPVLG